MKVYEQFFSVLSSVSVSFAPVTLEACNKPAGQDSSSAQAQGPAQPSQPASQQAPPTTQATPTPDELYQLVAPMALFPDNLVALVLTGATFPDEITAANTWLTQNQSLKGDALNQAVDKQSWDNSVKGLTQFPDVLKQMAGSLSWTSALGDAYFNVPQDVMNAVQVMRQRAQAAGNLKSNDQQKISVDKAAPPPAAAPAAQPVIVQAPPQTIIIQPAQPTVVYVPTYNPTVVYGAPVPAYPGYSTGAMVATGIISFGLGIAVGAAIANNNHCCGWGYSAWGCGWHSSTVVYHNNVYVSRSTTFVNRGAYYGRGNVNINNVNVNNVNRNNINTNNVNRNNVNNNNYRADNFNNNARNSSVSTPNFGQKYNQPQYKNTNGADLARDNRPAQNNRQAAGGAEQNRLGSTQNQNRPDTMNQIQRQPARGYGEQPARNTNSSAFSGYSGGGNARTNSARGQQSLSGGRSGARTGRHR